MSVESSRVLRHLREIITAPARPLAGQLFGPYELVAEIGRGAMGIVFRARDGRLDRTVALKIGVRDLAADEASRFAAEAKAAARLQHPNVAQIFEAGTQDGYSFIAMEYVDGDTLARLRLEPRRILEAMADAADAIHAAHAAGIVHRDLKPQNLMMGRDARVRVMDFGLARHVGSEHELTQSGTVLGTPAYMAPECAAGRRGDACSDIYALGATLYDLLTGSAPFAGSSALEVLERVRTAEPASPRQRDPRIHRDAETIVLKAMQRDRARRYTSAREFADDVRRHLRGEAVKARPVAGVVRAAKWMRRRPALGAACLVLAACALVATGFGLRQAAERTAERREAAAAHVARGREALADAARLARELDQLKAVEARLEESIPHDADVRRKRPLWDAARQIAATRERIESTRLLAMSEFTSAVAVDPANREARAAMAAIHFADFERAERRGDREAMNVSEQLSRMFDDGTLAPRFAREGTLELVTTPAGAEAYLFRYEEGSDRRFLPLPYGVRSRAVRRPDTEPRGGTTAYPLDFGDFNRLATTPIGCFVLPSGRYLVVLRKEGCRDTRYPVLVGRGTHQAASVVLYSDAEIGAGFVYVPGGPFISGGDPGAHDGQSREEAETGNLFIGRYEVTMAEYIAFLNDLLAHGELEEAQRRLMRIGPGAFVCKVPTASTRSLDSEHPDWPVFGVSWEDADAYCRWLTERARAAGELVTYRLPMVGEWEKAARGVDERAFPWGDVFDWTFTKGWWSGERPDGYPRIEAVGTFAADESPYGVRDLAGSMREWCLDAVDEHFRHECGGSFGDRLVSHYHSAARYWGGATTTAANTGFRIVRELEK